MPREPHIQVHHRGDRGVDGILRLIELASHDGPLDAMLIAMCDEIAAIAEVDIASIYVREDEALVMRGNHGFPSSAIGTALSIGEGITGLVAECMRPVSAAHAATESAYKHVPGLDEERFPVFVGVPLISGGQSAGVLVLQRKRKPFATDEVTLATALGAPITLAIERRRASAVRSARLEGRGHGGGIVLGRAAVMPTSTAISVDAQPTGADLERAIARLREDLGRAVKKLADAVEPSVGTTLDRFTLVLTDQRLRERLVAALGEPNGLRGVAKDYARVSYKVSEARRGSSADHDSAGDRVAEIEELCALIGVTMDSRTTHLGPGRITIADRLGAFVTVVAVARGAAALLASSSVAPAAIDIANAARLPLVGDVPGLFGWARPGDLLAVDGASGTVLVHPAPPDIERLRRARDEHHEPHDPTG